MRFGVGPTSDSARNDPVWPATLAMIRVDSGAIVRLFVKLEPWPGLPAAWGLLKNPTVPEPPLPHLQNAMTGDALSRDAEEGEKEGAVDACRPRLGERGTARHRLFGGP